MVVYKSKIILFGGFYDAGKETKCGCAPFLVALALTRLASGLLQVLQRPLGA